jgi:hypothetical protein
MSAMEIRFKDLSPHSKKNFKDALFCILKTGYQATQTDFADFIFAVSSIDYRLIKVDSKIKSFMRVAVVEKASMTPLRHQWKMVQGLSAIGFKWEDMDANFRY